MTMGTRETFGQEEQERYIEQKFPTGTITHDRVKGYTYISFSSGAKITLDWVALEREDLVNCIYLGFPLPQGLENALRHWNFTTLFLSEEGDESMKDAVHEVLTMRDNRYRDSVVYLYVQDRVDILSHPWSENLGEASTICDAWLRNARKQISDKPESAYVDKKELERFVTGMPGFMVKKTSSPNLLEKLGIDPEKLPRQIQVALTKKKP